jgi:hypothetical protein
MAGSFAFAGCGGGEDDREPLTASALADCLKKGGTDVKPTKGDDGLSKGLRQQGFKITSTMLVGDTSWGGSDRAFVQIYPDDAEAERAIKKVKDGGSLSADDTIQRRNITAKFDLAGDRKKVEPAINRCTE